MNVDNARYGVKEDVHCQVILEYPYPKQGLKDRSGCLRTNIDVSSDNKWEGIGLTLENMCVTGLVTLILSNPATHSKNPKSPVTKLPQTNTCAFHCVSDISSRRTVCSPLRKMNGRRNITEPAFVHQASWIVELLQ